jgi:hypothetical protein
MRVRMRCVTMISHVGIKSQAIWPLLEVLEL